MTMRGASFFGLWTWNKSNYYFFIVNFKSYPNVLKQLLQWMSVIWTHEIPTYQKSKLLWVRIPNSDWMSEIHTSLDIRHLLLLCFGSWTRIFFGDCFGSNLKTDTVKAVKFVSAKLSNHAVKFANSKSKSRPWLAQT